MTKLAFGLPAILLLAAATAPACAQEIAAKDPFAHQNGCVDFSAEYMGCLAGRPLDSSPNAEPAASTTASRIATSSVSQTRRQRDAIPPTKSSSDRSADVEMAIGHLGVP